MKIPKGLLVPLAIVALAVAGAGAWAVAQGSKRANAIAAAVNGEVIYWSQVDVEVARAAAQFGVDPKSPEFEKQRAEFEKTVIDQLVIQRLIMQEARKRNIVATDKDVDEQIATIKKRLGDEKRFNEALARANLTITVVRDLIRFQLTQRRVAEAAAQVTVTDDEVRKKFDENRSAYDRPSQIKVSHILFRIADKSQEAVAMAKARIAQAKLADGAKFEDVAKQYSEDPGSAERGGDLGGEGGYVSKGTMVKEFEEAAWALKPGETSGLVRTQYGLHIIKVFEVKPAEKGDFEKVKGQIRDQLLQGKREKAFEGWIDQQKKAAKVELFPRK